MLALVLILIRAALLGFLIAELLPLESMWNQGLIWTLIILFCQYSLLPGVRGLARLDHWLAGDGKIMMNGKIWSCGFQTRGKWWLHIIVLAMLHMVLISKDVRLVTTADPLFSKTQSNQPDADSPTPNLDDANPRGGESQQQNLDAKAGGDKGITQAQNQAELAGLSMQKSSDSAAIQWQDRNWFGARDRPLRLEFHEE